MKSSQGDDKIKRPWDNQVRVIPLRTFSGRVVYKRKVHQFTVKDVARILKNLEPPPGEDPGRWGNALIGILRIATISMIQRILWFLPPGTANDLYTFGIQLLDMMFRTDMSDDGKRRLATDGIYELANRAGLTVDVSYTK